MTGDTCPECGQPLPDAARDDDCTCGHGKAYHDITKARNVSFCTRAWCACVKYQPLEAK